jgi:hypothetical protein
MAETTSLPPNTRIQSDRFAREIAPIWRILVQRSRRLMRNLLGGAKRVVPIEVPLLGCNTLNEGVIR